MSSLSQDHDLAADAATVSERSAPSPAGHTPGPWANDDSEIYQAGRSFLIAETSPLPGDCDPSGFSPTELANARLIAAAPELLEALQGLIALIDDNPTATLAELMVVYRISSDGENFARAAIAKATATPSDAQSVRPDGGEG